MVKGALFININQLILILKTVTKYAHFEIVQSLKFSKKLFRYFSGFSTLFIIFKLSEISLERLSDI